jgi:parallel beta-helix repeat protein
MAASGGGIRVEGNSTPVIKNNRIDDNRARRGGGISVAGNSNPLIQNNAFTNNRATEIGAAQGIEVEMDSQPIITGNTLLPAEPMRAWHRIFGGPAHDGGNAVQQVADGGYVIAGWTASFGAGGNDVWLIKTDAHGNQEWQRSFGGPAEDVGRSVQQVADGGYIIAGWTASFGAGDHDVWLIKTNAHGNQEWQRTFGGPAEDRGFSVRRVAGDSYVIAGQTASFGAGGNDVWLIKTDAQGNLEWQRTFGGPAEDVGFSVQQAADGGYIAAGRTASFGAGDHDVWLIKTDAQGNPEWQRTFGGPAEDGGMSIQQVADGGYIIAGRTASFGAGDHGVWLIELVPERRRD